MTIEIIHLTAKIQHWLNQRLPAIWRRRPSVWSR